jgi:hypothetical protein
MILRVRSWRRLLSRDDKSRKTFHVKRRQRTLRALFHVKHLGRRCETFHVKQSVNPNAKPFVNGLTSRPSFADTELAKDHVEDILDIDPAK